MEVPDLVGRTKREIHEGYMDLRLDASGEGEVVVTQAPLPGSKVATGSTVRIYMGDKSDAND